MRATKFSYTAYQSAVADFKSKNHVRFFAPEHFEPEAGFEGHFSWQPCGCCGCCGSGLGGHRESYRFVSDDGKARKTFTADICSDCVYFLEYGRLDDSTMAEIEKG